MSVSVPVVCFVGFSGVGKTTLLEKLIPALVERGLRVGAVKHDAHSFQMDTPGKDTYRFRAAGAAAIAIASATERAVICATDRPTTLAELVAALPSDLDLVIAEGFKGSGAAKIEVRRRGHPSLAGHDVSGIIATATDHPGAADAPISLPLDDVEAITDFLIDRFTPHRARRA